MNYDESDRQQIESVLIRIPEAAWQKFLRDSPDIRELISAAVSLIKSSDFVATRASRKPVKHVVDIYGDNILSDRTIGPWIRYQLLVSLGARAFDRLEARFMALSSQTERSRYQRLRNARKKKLVMAERWRRGGHWSAEFCETLGLPLSLVQSRPNTDTEDAEIEPILPLPPLHEFQLQVYRAQRNLLKNGLGKAAMMSLPTGAGKTRVTVEAICDHLAESGGGKPVLWIAQSAELQEQAWECFREVWQVPPEPAARRRTERRPFPLQLIRLWGGRSVDNLSLPSEDAVLIASIDQLASWVRRDVGVIARLRKVGFSCVVVDEAHTLLTNEFRLVLISLGIRARKEWRMLSSSAPLIGLSATPWRSKGSESRALGKFFDRRLLKPRMLGNMPIEVLQRQGILSQVRYRRLRAKGIKPMSTRQRRRFEMFGDLPLDYLESLGREEKRNSIILNYLLALPKKRKTLVFACSVEHAKLLTLALNQAHGERVAALLTATTPRSTRHSVIEEFRRGTNLRFLCNVGVLVAGFDAPSTDVVCITRPTCSAARYEQMVGRAMRGPRNGGTEKCLILDVQDEGLPDEIQSYSRVLELWR